jgi:peptide/nickel transport system permease protein
VLRYVIRRLKFALPTLLIISLVVFGLEKCKSYDQALYLGDESFGNLQEQEAASRLRAKQAGLDKPVFYFSITTAAFPDTLYRILPIEQREKLKKLCAQTGNWPATNAYENTIRAIYTLSETLPDTLPATVDFRKTFYDLFAKDRLEDIESLFPEVKAAFSGLPAGMLPGHLFETLEKSIRTMREKAIPARMYIPAVHWYGFDNQYHHWLGGILGGDFGMSRNGQKPVWEYIRFSFYCTLIINSLALVLAYLVAVPLGVAMARRQSRMSDTLARWLLLFVYSMPVFWLGSLLLLLLATPDTGLFLINGIGLETYQGSGHDFGLWCWSNSDKFILPILTLSLHALALLALQMRGGVLDTIGQDYIRTARAKGLAEGAVYWRHAFRNALFPMITVFASLFSNIFTGALVVEYLFQFPGLGMKTQEAFTGGDYNVLFAILMLSAALTIVSNLIADLLYAWADPRVRF